jgi:hypothetical protein
MGLVIMSQTLFSFFVRVIHLMNDQRVRIPKLCNFKVGKQMESMVISRLRFGLRSTNSLKIYFSEVCNF